MKCGECDGSGQKTIARSDKAHVWERCPVCEGRGEIKLDKCPFCHGEAFYAYDKELEFEPHYIECEGCGISMYGETFSEVVKKWHTRYHQQMGLFKE